MELLSLLPLSLLVYSDARHRQVNVYVLAIFALLQGTTSLIEHDYSLILTRVLVNMGILLWLALGVLFYFLILQRKRFRELQYQVGAGDIFFLVALIPSFNGLMFARFLSLAFIVSLGAWYIYYRKGKHSTIPLVSTVGTVHGLFVISRYLCHL